MSDSAGREWRFYLNDMIGFAENVITYTEGFDQKSFVASGLNYDATLRNMELIGESAMHIPDDVRKSEAQIPWRMIIATRNQLIHGYLGIDNDTLWSIITDDVPELLAQLYVLRDKEI
ncbi:DUF86 domain-containing protein [Mariprofundus ferrooxydans]|uniref:HepT-like ribonuclease domain-containing protein n=1 Tax=Mariprofundus ferrooxydans TaxID=314344 RepID=UPI0014317ED2|nr:DUF86 domain-containing protein [Mariprofundus ferrooxydans]